MNTNYLRAFARLIKGLYFLPHLIRKHCIYQHAPLIIQGARVWSVHTVMGSLKDQPSFRSKKIAPTRPFERME
ncbi:MAG: hypothetical protein ACRC0M_09280, partial [Legionella sp.]